MLPADLLLYAAKNTAGIIPTVFDVIFPNYLTLLMTATSVSETAPVPPNT